MLDVVNRRFVDFGFPIVIDRNILPDDDSTLFICSGMQRVKNRFLDCDGSHYGSLQSCIRTNDLDLVGDGSHLTYFEMLGNFSFGGNDFELSVELWDSIIKDLNIPISEVHVHPSRLDHKQMWRKRNYNVVNDPTCQWSDGNISGECCELFLGDLEIGNLVNPLGHSTDVGFGWERLHQVVEGKSRVDETSLFDQGLDFISRDHLRTLTIMRECGIKPGSKGREYICRRLLRRVMDSGIQGFDEWIEVERGLRDSKIQRGKKKFKKFQDKTPEWWYETFGIFPEELSLLE